MLGFLAASFRLHSALHPAALVHMFINRLAGWALDAFDQKDVQRDRHDVVHCRSFQHPEPQGEGAAPGGLLTE